MRIILLLCLFLAGCSITVPEYVPGWDFSVTNSPFAIKEMVANLECMILDWENEKGDSYASLKESARGTKVRFFYDASGEQHLPNTEHVHGRYIGTYTNEHLASKEILLAWGDDDTLSDTSWTHEWAHLFLHVLYEDLDSNHLKSPGPWDEKVQYIVYYRKDCQE